MTITFLNVGHGDTILVEWGADNIGVIDCNKYKDVNKAVEIIKDKDLKKIDFIILSHPHYDHYSGMRELLIYCQEKKIIIERFYHTSFTHPKYLKSAVKGVIAKKELGMLFLKIKELHSSRFIKHQTYVHNDIREIALNKDISIEVLAPSSEEFQEYNSKTFTDAEENHYSSPHGNWLSTILKIYTDDWYVLLTSDVEQSVLKKVGYESDKLNSNLILCQSPHHGSLKNHSSIFWRQRRRNEAKVVFSVGNNQYDHPAKKVIDKFKDYMYEIYSTNLVGGLTDHEGTAHEVQEMENLLSIIDVKDSDSGKAKGKYQGDKSFEIRGNVALLV